MAVQDGDKFIVNRGGIDHKVTASDLDDKLQDTDEVLINRGGTDYKVSGNDLRQYLGIAKPLPPPWEGQSYVHVKNATGKVVIKKEAKAAWNVTPNGDGTYSWSNRGKITEFNPGDELVFIPDKFSNLFCVPDNHNDSPDWEFGELCDTSEVKTFEMCFRSCRGFTGKGMGYWDPSSATTLNRMFDQCDSFDCDISHWDVSNVGFGETVEVNSMLYLFSKCKVFNQDLSKWCVQHIPARPSYFDNGTDKWEDKNKPVWGTCPRGENKP